MRSDLRMHAESIGSFEVQNSAEDALRAENDELRRQNDVLRAENAELKQASAEWQQFRISSPCISNSDSTRWEDLPKIARDGWSLESEARLSGGGASYLWWNSWCPCCRRPLDLQLKREPDALPRSLPPSVVPRYAYVAALWGANPGFSLGGLVLGASLRRHGTKHDLVLLHTDDVPDSARLMLSEIWTLKLVERVSGDPGLFVTPGTRFDGVFTKLHVFGLTEYTKVLMMDLDLAVLCCLDELFELPAPAAMHRNSWGAGHGDRINGRQFFVGDTADADGNIYEWCQCGGINAGIMLLEPDGNLHKQVLRDVTLRYHPERIPGNGPEQDYLSRVFAPSWSHIGAAYNFQLHRLFHSLEPALWYGVSDPLLLPERLRLRVGDVKVVHFSGELKIWEYVLKMSAMIEDVSVEEFAGKMLRHCSEYYCRLYLDLEGTAEEYAKVGLSKDDDGKLLSNWDDLDSDSMNRVLENALALVCGAALRATQSWVQECKAMHLAFPALPPLREMCERLVRPSWPIGACFQYQERVNIWWHSEWYPATVVASHADGRYSVVFDEGGSWGTDACVWPKYIEHQSSKTEVLKLGVGRVEQPCVSCFSCLVRFWLHAKEAMCFNCA